MVHRDTTDAVTRSGGVVIDGMVTRTRGATGQTLLIPGRNDRSKAGRMTGDSGKAADGERESDGSEVAARRGNARSQGALL